MIYDAAKVRWICTKFQVNVSKNKMVVSAGKAADLQSGHALRFRRILHISGWELLFL